MDLRDALHSLRAQGLVSAPSCGMDITFDRSPSCLPPASACNFYQRTDMVGVSRRETLYVKNHVARPGQAPPEDWMVGSRTLPRLRHPHDMQFRRSLPTDGVSRMLCGGSLGMLSQSQVVYASLLTYCSYTGNEPSPRLGHDVASGYTEDILSGQHGVAGAIAGDIGTSEFNIRPSSHGFTWHRRTAPMDDQHSGGSAPLHQQDPLQPRSDWVFPSEGLSPATSARSSTPDDFSLAPPVCREINTLFNEGSAVDGGELRDRPFPSAGEFPTVSVHHHRLRVHCHDSFGDAVVRRTIQCQRRS